MKIASHPIASDNQHVSKKDYYLENQKEGGGSLNSVLGQISSPHFSFFSIFPSLLQLGMEQHPKK